MSSQLFSSLGSGRSGTLGPILYAWTCLVSLDFRRALRLTDDLIFQLTLILTAWNDVVCLDLSSALRPFYSALANLISVLGPIHITWTCLDLFSRHGPIS